jgi:Zn-dependent peptidase ImmA (M78 family)
MSNDYRVKSRSNSEVLAIAKQARDFFGVANDERVDVLACLDSDTIWTVRGLKKLRFETPSQSIMGLDDGRTTFEKDVVRIQIKDTVANRAIFGHGRSRNTCAHEMGHGVLCHDVGVPMARQTIELATPGWIPSYESAEHQAKVFGPAFLINDAIAKRLESADELSAVFGISLQSAKIEFEKLLKARDHAKHAAEILRKAAQFKASMMPAQRELQYLQELCTNCKQQNLIAMGTKYMCLNCKHVSDRFQDGDSVA